ncbi:MAG: AAA family ATPase [Oscillospiraceae bacterium]
MAQVIMVASGKGGTGKSTVATFLATEFALRGKKTFLTELDTGLRSIDIISGTSELTVYDIGDVLCGQVSAQKAMITSPHTPNLSIIPAPYKNHDVDFSGLKRELKAIEKNFDYMIIDTAAGVGKAFYGALSAADYMIIVATADMISVRDARVVSDEAFNKGIKNIRLIINKFDKSNFKQSGFYDGDEIIDECCAQLLGVLPQSAEIAIKAMNGELLPKDSIEKKIFTAITDRMQGIEQPILIK